MDFRVHYGIDLADWIQRRVPVERTLALIRLLPLGSHYVSARQGGPEYVGWDLASWQMADLLDQTAAHAFAFMSANSKKKLKAPDPYPRPGVKKVIKKASGLISRLRGQREETGSLPVEDPKIIILGR